MCSSDQASAPFATCCPSSAHLVAFRALHAGLDHHARIEQLCEHLRKQRLANLRLDEHESIGRDCSQRSGSRAEQCRRRRTVDVVLEKIEQARWERERRCAKLVDPAIRSDSAQAGAARQESARFLVLDARRRDSPVAVVVANHDRRVERLEIEDDQRSLVERALRLHDERLAFGGVLLPDL